MTTVTPSQGKCPVTTTILSHSVMPPPTAHHTLGQYRWITPEDCFVFQTNATGLLSGACQAALCICVLTIGAVQKGRWCET